MGAGRGGPMDAGRAGPPAARRGRGRPAASGRRGAGGKEKWVETLVVADAKMVEYHGQPNVESYVLTIMNMVRPLWAVRRGW